MVLYCTVNPDRPSMSNQNRNVGRRGPKKSKNNNSLMSHYRGMEMKIVPQPPEFVSRPWFSLTVRLESIGTTVGLNSIVTAINSQLGLTTEPIAVRLQHVKVYAPLVAFGAGGPLTPLSVGVLDFIAENVATTSVAPTRVIEQFTRYPDQVNRACVGFRYGVAHSSLTLQAAAGTADTNILTTIGAGPGSLALFHVLFRTGLGPPAAASVSKGFSLF